MMTRTRTNCRTKTGTHKSKEELDSDVVHGEDDVRIKKITKTRTHKSEQESDSGTDIQLKKRKGRVASADEKANEEAMQTSHNNVEVDKENDEVWIDDEKSYEDEQNEKAYAKCKESDKPARVKASGKNVTVVTISSSDEEKAEKVDESGIEDLLSKEIEESQGTRAS